MRISDWSSDVCSSDLPDRKAMQEIGSLLHDKSWLMRLGAVRATESFPTPIKWQLLQPQLDEPVAAVRYVLAEQLAGVSLQHLPARDQARLQVLFADYLQRLAFTIDRQSTRLNSSH